MLALKSTHCLCNSYLDSTLLLQCVIGLLTGMHVHTLWTSKGSPRPMGQAVLLTKLHRLCFLYSNFFVPIEKPFLRVQLTARAFS